jgi:hypothetical protein
MGAAEIISAVSLILQTVNRVAADQARQAEAAELQKLAVIMIHELTRAAAVGDEAAAAIKARG